MSRLIATIGIPGSGKSHWVKSQKVAVVSLDSIRAELGDISDQSNNDKVYFISQDRARKLLTAGKDVIFDSTGLGKGMLRKLRLLAEQTNSTIEYKIFECSIETAKNRIKADIENGINRAHVPDEVIEFLFNRFELVIRNLKDKRLI